MDTPLGKPFSRSIGTNIPYLTVGDTGIQVSGTPYKAPKGHPIKAIVPHLQETAIPHYHSHWRNNCRSFFLWHAIMQVL